MATNRGLVAYSSCTWCFEKYKTSKMLTCGHTFCLQCIQSMVKKSITKCPKCQKIFQLPSSGRLEDYPTYYVIEERNCESNDDQANASEDEEDSAENQMKCTVNCILHDQPYEFFCKTCLEQTCKNCLLSKHNLSKHKITTKEDYLQEQSQDVQKLTKQLDGLISVETDLGKQLAKADSKYQQEAKKLEDQIMEDLEKKIERLRKEADEMIKDVSEESQRKREKLKKLRQEQSSLMTKTREQEQSNDAVKRAIKMNDVTHPNKLKEIKKKVDQTSKQIIHLQQSSEAVRSGLNLKFQKTQHQFVYLGYLESTDTSSSIQDSLLSLKKTPRKIILPALLIMILLSILLISGAYLSPATEDSIECLPCPLFLLNLVKRLYKYRYFDSAELQKYCGLSMADANKLARGYSIIN